MMMMIFLWRICFLIYLLNNLNTVVAELIVKPNNTLVDPGKETILWCCSNSSSSILEWKFRKWNNGDVFNQICRGQKCDGDIFSIDSHIPGCSGLIVNSSSVEVAGLYQCSELKTEFVCGAHLFVYQFNCSHNVSSEDELVEGLKVVFTCTALWSGELPFEMVAMTAGGKEIMKTRFSQSQDSYSSSLPVDLLRPILPSYTFRIQPLIRITDECIDKQSPVVNWSSSAEKVMYAVTNIRTNCPKKDCEKKKGDLIHCSADGFPFPKFQWLNWDLKPVGESSVLQVKDVGSFNFTCISRNTINGQDYEERESIVVTVPEDREGMSLFTIFGICVVISIHFIIQVLEPVNIRKFLQVCFKKMKKICRCSEIGTGMTPDDDSLPTPIEQQSGVHCDINPQEVNKDPEETEGYSPLSQVDEVDVEKLTDGDC